MSDRFGAAAVIHFRLAAQLLGWRPHEFWSATPAELGSALGPQEGTGGSLSRGELNRMMEHDHADHRR